MTDGEIYEAIQARVTTVAQSARAGLPISYVDVTFDPPADKRWLEIIFAARNSSPFLSTKQRLEGSVRLILHWPKGGGVLEPMTLCETIADSFLSGASFDNIRLSQALLLGSPIQTDEDVMYPMTMRYYHLT